MNEYVPGQHSDRLPETFSLLSQAPDAIVQDTCDEAGIWMRQLLGRPVEGHECQVTLLALRLALEAGEVRTTQGIRQVIWAGMLHDIGKSAIDPRIINKPGGLTDQEQEIMRHHPSLGRRLASMAPGVDAEILTAINHHHERWDGQGYPAGLIGESIPMLARILKVADVYDALVTDRPYRPAWSTEEAVTYLMNHAGTDFDPRLVRVFVHQVLCTHGSQDSQFPEF
ncbi:HD-GYP domain-containing protein [Deinococcus koreensis]|uniref:HD-GYP domain-containing protein n=1 Tax=Deinococcus koreensis TaxID=2054903 RepID=A0A2K3UVN5_9DEIO|nr:HD-GYP domain-containing protein [Deinococcus koreensis]PNY80591.1 HD-GYP domain-containing protein [Deinococcus koreensis]